MPTQFEMKQRNAKFANAVRAGKKATHESQAEKRLHKSPLNAVALGIIVFVVVGGVIFEFLSLFFL